MAQLHCLFVKVLCKAGAGWPGKAGVLMEQQEETSKALRSQRMMVQPQMQGNPFCD